MHSPSHYTYRHSGSEAGNKVSLEFERSNYRKTHANIVFSEYAVGPALQLKRQVLSVRIICTKVQSMYEFRTHVHIFV